MTSFPTDHQYKGENEDDTNDLNTTENAQSPVSQALDANKDSTTNPHPSKEGQQSDSENSDQDSSFDSRERDESQYKSTERTHSPGKTHGPKTSSDGNLSSSAQANINDSHITTSPPEPTSSGVAGELSSDKDTQKMPLHQPKSLPEDSIPLKIEESPISPTHPSNGAGLGHVNGTPVLNGAPHSARPINGSLPSRQTKYSTLSVSGLSEDGINGSEKQKLVSSSSDFPDKPGQKRVDIECEETNLLECYPTRDVSNLRTYMNLYKALTGPSTVGMPRVIANGGLLTGFAGFLLIGFLNAHCNITMVQCGRILGKRTGKSWYTYEDIIEGSLAVQSDKPNWQKAARYGRQLALVMLILCQFGLMSFYYQIIATTIQKELELFFDAPVGPLVLIELCVCVCVLPYSWVRNLRLQAWFSTFANILNVTSIAIILQYAVRHMKPLSSVNLVPADPWNIPLFIGGAVFTVEGIAMILPIENRARHPKDYTGPFGMVALATATNVIVNLATGFYGYLAFGEDVSGNILVSLPDMWLYRLVSIMYAGMVFLTYNLQLYQPAEAIYAWLRAKYPSNFVLNYGNLTTRTVLVILTFLFAALVPRVDLMMALIGAFCAGFLVFILPIIAELLLLHTEPGGITWCVWVKDVLILLFGITAFLTGTYTSVRDIVKTLESEH